MRMKFDKPGKLSYRVSCDFYLAVSYYLIFLMLHTWAYTSIGVDFACNPLGRHGAPWRGVTLAQRSTRPTDGHYLTLQFALCL